MITYILVFLGCVVGCGLNTVCGFGFGVFCMMFLPYLLGSTTSAATLINIVVLVQATWIAIRYRKHIHFRLMLPPLVTYFIFSTLAVRFAAGLGNDTLRMILGFMLLGLSLYFLLIARNLHIKGCVRNGLIAGGVGGVMSGLFSIGGPPVSLYYSAVTDEKEAYQGTLQFYFVITNIYMTFLRAREGYITKNVLLCTAIGLCGMALGTLLGTRVFKRMNVSMIRITIYCMMGISGIIMLLDTFVL